MLRNYLAAALRNFARNKLYAGINVAGLAIGFAAAMLVGLFVRDELSYDRFLPGHDRIFLLAETLQGAAMSTITTPMTQATIAAAVKTQISGVEAVARLAPTRNSLRNGQIEAAETVYWADPDFFSVVPLKAIAGDLRSALQRPDSVVLTRSVARKYFHTDRPIGARLEIDRSHVLQVTAVLENLPTNTHLDTRVFASGRTSFGELMAWDTNAPGYYPASDAVYTYLRLKQGASAASLDRELPAMAAKLKNITVTGIRLSLQPLPVTTIHLTPLTHTHKVMRPAADLASIYAVGSVGVLIVLVASINFVNLMTARASRRAVEVGIRKTAGARRADLVVQFIGESLLYSTVAMLLAMLLIELTLPAFSAFMGHDFSLGHWHDPILAGGLLAVLLLTGILAGAYPAFVLSGFSPALVLKSGRVATAGSERVREALVVLQFAILIGLIVTTGMIHRQASFAMNEGLRIDRDSVLIVESTCANAFPDQVRALKGVRAVACSGLDGLNMGSSHYPFDRRDGTTAFFLTTSVGYDFFELYGLPPKAGRVFSRAHSGDTLPSDFLSLPQTSRSTQGPIAPRGRVVINETAVRQFGFASNDEAVGQVVYGFGRIPVQIVGVVPDFSVDSIHKRIEPAVYAVYPPSFGALSVKLSGTEIPETLASIDRLWKDFGDPKPIARYFLDQHLQSLYVDVTRRARMFSAFAAVAVFIACLGLFGLAAFRAERRTKEIGIRKAMGASTVHILRLLVWQFAKPVLWANLIAWPVGAFFLDRWLRGFAYHVTLELWVFVASTLLALLIAMLTVSTHAFVVASARPGKALRYE
jgi:putative ABC transport system permease protein